MFGVILGITGLLILCANAANSGADSSEYTTENTVTSTITTTDLPTTTNEPSTVITTDLPTTTNEPSTISTTDLPTTTNEPSSIITTDLPTTTNEPSTVITTDLPTTTNEPSTVLTTDLPTTTNEPSTISTTDLPTTTNEPSSIITTDLPTTTNEPSTVITTDLPTTTNEPSTITTPKSSQDVCIQLAKVFNSINNVLPIRFSFPGGEIAGMNYPDGQIILNSEARNFGGCQIYPLIKTKTVIAHVEIEENFEIHFSQFIINDKPRNVKMAIKDSHAVLHYYITEVENDGKHLLHLNVLMAEIKNLGSVTLESDYEDIDGLDYTKAAEDVLRPMLLEGFNGFAKKDLRWTIDPADGDLSRDGLDAFKIVFKRMMIGIDGIYRTH